MSAGSILPSRWRCCRSVLFVTWIGFFNVGASTGHWKITEWFLHFAMRSAVRTYALAVEVPDELPRHAIQPAAAHFARGCAICHGAPGEPRSPAVHLMLPHPPDLRQGRRMERRRALSHRQAWRAVHRHARMADAGSATTRSGRWSCSCALCLTWTGYWRDLLMAAACRRSADADFGASARRMRPLPRRGRGRTQHRDAFACRPERGLSAGEPARPMPMAGARAASWPCRLPPSIQIFAGLARHSRAAAAARRHRRRIQLLSREARRSRDRAYRQHTCRHALAATAARTATPSTPNSPGSPPTMSKPAEAFRSGKRGGTRYEHLMRNAARNLTDEDIDALATYFAQMPRIAATERR